MKLEDFVRDTLVSIANGVDSARKALEGTAALVNPAFPDSRNAVLNEHEVEFDVAVTVSGERKVAGNGGIRVLNVTGESSKQYGASSRVIFRVGLHIPTTPATRPAKKKKETRRRSNIGSKRFDRWRNTA